MLSAASRVRSAKKKSNRRTASYHSSRQSDTGNHADRRYLSATTAAFRHHGFIQSRSHSSAHRHHNPVGRRSSRASLSGTVSRYYRYGPRSGNSFQTSRKYGVSNFSGRSGAIGYGVEGHLLMRIRSGFGFLSA